MWSNFLFQVIRFSHEEYSLTEARKMVLKWETLSPNSSLPPYYLWVFNTIDHLRSQVALKDTKAELANNRTIFEWYLCT